MGLVFSSLVVIVAVYVLYRIFPKATPKSFPFDAQTERLLTEKPKVEIEQPDIADFAKQLSSYNVTEDYRECAEHMKELLRSGHINYTAHEEDPSKILRVSGFITSDYTALLTRFTVQYNLYAGSIVALGTDEQRQQLYANQHKAELGCFAFTEVGAGVMTGVRVDTTATLTEDNKHFIITCPTPEARKNWISQGYVASKAVVLARLIVKGKDHGPHLFWVDFRENDQLLDGLNITLVPQKSSMNGLDNAIIDLQNFKVSRSCLLSRFSSVDEQGNFSSNFPAGCKRIMDLVLTRLLTGRLCLAEFSLHYALDLLRHNWEYCLQRKLFRGNQRMCEINSINQFFSDRARVIAMLLEFVCEARERGCESIKNGAFTPYTVELASMVKYLGTGFALDTNFGLKKIMGSEALFTRSRLGLNTEVLLSTCFAEGDNALMEKKIVLDTALGRSERFSVERLKKAILHSPQQRKVAIQYIKLLLKAMIMGKKAQYEDQLLRDIAWAKAHLYVLDCFDRRTSGKNYNQAKFLQSYDNVLLKWPVPTIF